MAYRASNTVQVEVDDLKKVGDVIDAGMKAGANRIEGVSFDLKDDTAARENAIREAIKEARAKAQTMAAALNVKLGTVHQVQEGGVHLVRPQMMAYDRAVAGAAAATPVQPGQVHVQASVSVTYRLDRSQTVRSDERTLTEEIGEGVEELIEELEEEIEMEPQK